MTVNIERYKEYVISKVSMRTLDDPELAAALGMGGEVGEILDVIKKLRYHNHPAGRHYLLEEMGDLFFYFVLMLEAHGYTLENIVDFNMRKLDERYPDGFEPDRSMNRQ
jgi:NTP pyrophosphatase (non-canonical NTP hydrolase)